MAEKLKNTIIIYHKNCPDGMAAAAIAYKQFGYEAHYIPVYDRKNLPEYVIDHEDKINTEVYILDFCYPRDQLFFIRDNFKKLIVIDHHISAKDDVLAVDGVFVDGKSGSLLTWEYFNPNIKPSKFLEVIDEVDLHRDEDHDEETEALICYVNSVSFTVEEYTRIMSDYDDRRAEYIAHGRSINKYIQQIEDVVESEIDLINFEGYVIPAINLFLDVNTRSRVLAYLYKKYPPFAMSYRYDDGMWKIVLRGNGDVDLSKIAEKYGRGGHRNAAEFSIPCDGPLPFAKHVGHIKVEM